MARLVCCADCGEMVPLAILYFGENEEMNGWEWADCPDCDITGVRDE